LARRHRIGDPPCVRRRSCSCTRPRRTAARFRDIRARGARRVDLFSLGGTLSSFREGGLELTTRLLGKTSERDVAIDPENPFSERRAFVVTRVGSVGDKPVLLERLYFDPTCSSASIRCRFRALRSHASSKNATI